MTVTLAVEAGCKVKSVSYGRETARRMLQFDSQNGNCFCKLPVGGAMGNVSALSLDRWISILLIVDLIALCL